MLFKKIKLKKQKKAVRLAVWVLALFSIFLFSFSAFAQVSETGGDFMTDTGLGTRDVRDIIVGVVKIVLGFLSILATVIIIYGGYMWMTSAGNVERVQKAKKLLVSAVIGLIIILSAFAIVVFVIERMQDAVFGGCSPGDMQTCHHCPGCPGQQICDAAGAWGVCTPTLACPDPASFCLPVIAVPDFYITHYVPVISPPCTPLQQVPRNVQLRIFFNRPVDDTSIPGNVTVVNSTTGVPVAGTLTGMGNWIRFVPDDACPPPNDTLMCFDLFTTFDVTVAGGPMGVRSGALQLTCSNPSYPCTSQFCTNDIVDTSPPTVSVSPLLPQVCHGDNVMVSDGSDDYGLSSFEYYQMNDFTNIIGDDVVPQPPPAPNYTTNFTWNTVALGIMDDPVYFHTRVSDLVGLEVQDTYMNVLRPAHCCNGEYDFEPGDPDLVPPWDTPEEGIDCGGDCAACTGAPCAVVNPAAPPACLNINDSLCASGWCNPDTCLCDDHPEIIYIDPANDYPGTPAYIYDDTPYGAPGNFVTIYGRGFGSVGSLFENQLSFVNFEATEAEIFGPGGWSRSSERESSVSLDNTVSYSGSQSIRISQNPGHAYPDICEQWRCELPHCTSFPCSINTLQYRYPCTWDPVANQCDFADDPTTCGDCRFNEGSPLLWNKTNRIMWASLNFDISDLDFELGERYVLRFRYQGVITDRSGVRQRVSYNPSWVSQSWSRASDPDCIAHGGPYCSSSPELCVCSDEPTTCCTQAPVQTRAYNASNLHRIPYSAPLPAAAVPFDVTSSECAAPDNGWCLYEAEFTYTPEMDRLRDRDGNPVRRLSFDIGRNNTLTGTDFYIDDVVFAQIPMVGEVRFCGADTDGDGNPCNDPIGADDRLARFPSEVNPECLSTWKDDYIVVVVPEGAVTGPIQVITESGIADRTDDAYGRLLPDFEVTSDILPGLCLVENPLTLVNQGAYEDSIRAAGINFGDVRDPAQDNLAFGEGGDMVYSPIAGGAWSATEVSGSVPNLQPGVVGIRVENDGLMSNSLPWQMTARVDGPFITMLSPDHGDNGQYVTISGRYFGNTLGVVNFYNTVTGTTYAGDFSSFPPDCPMVDLWKDNQIIVKVPPLATNDLYDLYIRRTDGEESNRVNFIVDDSPLTPGICKIMPSMGPVGSAVELFGEYFTDRVAATPEHYIVAFHDQIFLYTMANPPAWGPENIEANVPNGAVTGQVFVRLTASGSNLDSNRVDFRVGTCTLSTTACDGAPATPECMVGSDPSDAMCPDPGIHCDAIACFCTDCNSGEQCCPEGTSFPGSCMSLDGTSSQCGTGDLSCDGEWCFEVSEGSLSDWICLEPCPDPTASAISSPSPENGLQTACVDAQIRLSFVQPVQNGALNTFGLFVCNSGGGFDRSACSPIEGADFQTNNLLTSISSSASIAECGAVADSQLQGAHGGLNPNTWYLAVARGGAVGLQNAAGEPMPANYEWHFKTRDDPSQCEVIDLIITPPHETITSPDLLDPGGTAVFSADMVAAYCQAAACPAGGPGWDRRGPNATLANFAMDAANQCLTTWSSSGMGETVPGPDVEVYATHQTYEDTSYLTIDFEGAKLIERYPDCLTACINARVGGVFSMPMNEASVQSTIPENVLLFSCGGDASCSSDNLMRIPIDHASLYNPMNNGLEINFPTYNGGLLVHNSYYRVVLLDGITAAGTNDPLRGLNYTLEGYWIGPKTIPANYTAINQEAYSWVFKTKDDYSLCAINEARVTPRTAYLHMIGEQQLYLASAYGSPDECNSDGQILDPSYYDWTWESSDVNVAVISSLYVAGNNLCGNGWVNLGEDCDDGNSYDGVCSDPPFASCNIGSEPDGCGTCQPDGCSSNCLNMGSSQLGEMIPIGNGDFSQFVDASNIPGWTWTRTHDRSYLDGDGNSVAECSTQEGSIVYIADPAHPYLAGDWEASPQLPVIGFGTNSAEICLAPCLPNQRGNYDGMLISDTFFIPHNAQDLSMWARLRILSFDNHLFPAGSPDRFYIDLIDPAANLAPGNFNPATDIIANIETIGPVVNFNAPGSNMNWTIPASAKGRNVRLAFSFSGHSQSVPPSNYADACVDGSDDAALFQVDNIVIATGGCGDGVVQYGEECEVGFNGVWDKDCDPVTCLNLGNANNNVSVCGNGRVEYGEDCDPGPSLFRSEDRVCIGGPQHGVDCALNPGVCVGGGICLQHLNGCSEFCLNTGHIEGRGICGNGTIEAGEECDENQLGAGQPVADDDFDNDGEICSANCLRMGNIAAGSCGNGIIEIGEECDDGNIVAGDGCSPTCQNEGVTLRGEISVCGNGIVEEGEDCDDGSQCSDGTYCTSHAVCLGIGDQRCLPRSGDGCSDRCLHEGSIAHGYCSSNHSLRCTSSSAPAGCGPCVLVGDYRQIATAVGQGDTLISARAEDPVNAISRIGMGELHVVCGNVYDSDCPDFNYWGVGKDTCCYRRPLVETCFPTGDSTVNPVCADGAVNVCRNGVITATFDQEMDPSSITGNMLVAASYPAGTVCSEIGLSNIVAIENLEKANQNIGFVQKIKNYFTNIIAGITNKDALAALFDDEGLKWCLVPGEASSNSYKNVAGIMVTDIIFTPQILLPSNTRHRAIIMGDQNPQDNNRSQGVRSRLGVTLNGEPSSIAILDSWEYAPGQHLAGKIWEFTTGVEPCTISYVNVLISPADPTDLANCAAARSASGDLFTCAERNDCACDQYAAPPVANSTGNQHKYTAIACHNLEGAGIGQMECFKGGARGYQLASIPGAEFAYEWQESDLGQIIELNVLDNQAAPTSLARDANCAATSSVVSGADMRTVAVSACLKEDLISTITSIIYDSNPNDAADVGRGQVDIPVRVFPCNNPWPSVTAFPWQDNDIPDTPGPPTRFETYYCRDRGNTKVCVGGLNDGEDCTENVEICVDFGGVCAMDTTDDLPILRYPPGIYTDINTPGMIKGIHFYVDGFCEGDPSIRCNEGTPCPAGPPALGPCLYDYHDLIGVRVQGNDSHFSPQLWYYYQNLPHGTPAEMIVDQYRAMQEGRTTYIAASNVTPADIRSNVWVFSYNQNAAAETKEIYRQLLNNLSFNYNLPITNICKTTKVCSGGEFAGSVCSDDLECVNAGVCQASVCVGGDYDGSPCGDDTNCRAPFNCMQKPCLYDYQCLESDYCLSDKSKVARDTARMADITDIVNSVYSYRGQCNLNPTIGCEDDSFCPGRTCVGGANHGVPCAIPADCTSGNCGVEDICSNRNSGYPPLGAGTYIIGQSTSAWDSWNNVLGPTLNMSLALDPLNVFALPCHATDPNYEESSCWNSVTKQFRCPAESHVYHYATSGPSDENFAVWANLEYTTLPWSHDCASNTHRTSCMLNKWCDWTGAACQNRSPVLVQPCTPGTYNIMYGSYPP